jgi:hypothetical protein
MPPGTILEPVQYLAKPWVRKGLKRKSHRICISKSEELERKTRFAAFYAANAPKFRITNEFLNRLLKLTPAPMGGLCFIFYSFPPEFF